MLYILPVGSVTYFHDLANVVGGSYNTVYIGLLIVRLFRFTLHQADKSICTPPNIHVLIGTFID